MSDKKSNTAEKVAAGVAGGGTAAGIALAGAGGGTYAAIMGMAGTVGDVVGGGTVVGLIGLAAAPVAAAAAGYGLVKGIKKLFS